MLGLHHLAQAVLRHMGVDLGGGDVGVAEQGLDHPQIRAALQQVGGEGVAQDVRADPGRIDAGRRAVSSSSWANRRGSTARPRRGRGTARGFP